MPDINATLDERSTTHGDFSQVGIVAQTLKRILRQAPGWDKLVPAQQEALEMDCAKTARILCGNPNEQDHWFDKAGYATLGARACSHKDNQAVMEPRRLGATVYKPAPREPTVGEILAEPARRLGAAGDKPSVSPAVPFTLPAKKEEPPKSA